MGRVWRATDVVLHREVAIKELVPPPGLTPGERQEMRERSLREARAIARLNNINVVRVFDVLRTDADPWIVMEYVPSRSLQDTLAADGPYNPVRTAEIGLGVLNALKAAHRAGVVHRDIKPGNVLIGGDGRVVLTDFGLATVPGDPNVTRTGLVLGSPAYIAPERARDGTAGPAADLWSLGATLYAAVEGQSPFARPSAIATLAALATENVPQARNAGPLKPVLNGLLRKDPAHRIDAEEAERLLARAAGRKSKISFPMSPTMRRPGAGRERPSLPSGPGGPPVLPGSGFVTATGSAPVVPTPRPPVTGRPDQPNRPHGTPGAPGSPGMGDSGMGSSGMGNSGMGNSGQGRSPMTPGRAPFPPATPAGRSPIPPSTPGRSPVPPATPHGTPMTGPSAGRGGFTPGRATVGRATPGQKPLDATKVDGPAITDDQPGTRGPSNLAGPSGPAATRGPSDPAGSDPAGSGGRRGLAGSSGRPDLAGSGGRSDQAGTGRSADLAGGRPGSPARPVPSELPATQVNTARVGFTAADVAANRRKKAAPEHEASLAAATGSYPVVSGAEQDPDNSSRQQDSGAAAATPGDASTVPPAKASGSKAATRDARPGQSSGTPTAGTPTAGTPTAGTSDARTAGTSGPNTVNAPGTDTSDPVGRAGRAVSAGAATAAAGRSLSDSAQAESDKIRATPQSDEIGARPAAVTENRIAPYAAELPDSEPGRTASTESERVSAPAANIQPSVSSGARDADGTGDAEPADSSVSTGADRKAASDSRKPDSGDQQPVVDSRKPESAGAQPVAGSRTPQSNGQQSIAGSRKPGSDSRTPLDRQSLGSDSGGQRSGSEAPESGFTSEADGQRSGSGSGSGSGSDDHGSGAGGQGSGSGGRTSKSSGQGSKPGGPGSEPGDRASGSDDRRQTASDRKSGSGSEKRGSGSLKPGSAKESSRQDGGLDTAGATAAGVVADASRASASTASAPTTSATKATSGGPGADAETADGSVAAADSEADRAATSKAGEVAATSKAGEVAASSGATATTGAKAAGEAATDTVPAEAKGRSQDTAESNAKAQRANDSERAAGPRLGVESGPGPAGKRNAESGGAAERAATPLTPGQRPGGTPEQDQDRTSVVDFTAIVPQSPAVSAAEHDGATRVVNQLPGFRPSSRPAWTPISTRPVVRRVNGITIFGTTLTRRQATIAAAIVLTFVLLIGIILVQAFGSDDDKKATSTKPGAVGTGKVAPPGKPAASTGADKPASMPPSAAPSSAAPSGGVPAGWSKADFSGFSLALPQGYQIGRSDAGQTEIKLDGNRLLIVLRGTDTQDPAAQLNSVSRSGFQRVGSIRPLQYQGRPAADLEYYYYTSHGNKQHVVRRAFSVGGASYQICWYTSPDDWDSAAAEREAVFAGFQAG
ncbi:Cortactin-binding protein 2 [Actinoplanes sp. SE50]|nr:Cortactin-binding protein 2 [Actinoplanes sp. SE50]SLM04424.1 Serine/threonine-protein kinase PrkC [Actinoplanes sp. SE50/110]